MKLLPAPQLLPRGRMPVHAVAGWLTDHPSSVTIRPPRGIVWPLRVRLWGQEPLSGGDPGHMGMFCGYRFLIPGRHPFLS